MKTNRLARALTLILALVLALATFAGCATDENPQGDPSGDQGTQAPATQDPTADLYDENGYLKDQIPEGLNFQRELEVLCWASVANEFACDEINGTPINDALVTRDINVEDRLGIELHYLMDKLSTGSVTDVGHYTKLVQSASMQGDPFDIVAQYGRTAAILSYQGYLENFLSIEDSYINLENPWWTGNLFEELRVGNSLYLLAGDITPSIYEQPYILFYNVDMIESFGLEDPYSRVKKNEWTMEIFRSYTKDITVNPDGAKGYGYSASRSNVPSLIHGCDIMLMEPDENSFPKISDDLYSEKMIDIVDDLTEWAKEDAYLIAKTAAEARAPFLAEASLFLSDRVIECLNFVESCNFSYSVVPTPKFNSDQSRYYTTLDTQLTFYCLMKGLPQEDLSMLTAVLECLGSEGYRLTSPAVVETCLMSRYAQTEQMSEMLRLCIENVYYDFGRIYSSGDNQYLCDRAGIIIHAGTPTWSNYLTSSMPAVAAQFQSIVDKFMEMEQQAQ